MGDETQGNKPQKRREFLAQLAKLPCAALLMGGFFMAGVSAWLIRAGKEVEASKKTLRLSVIFGLVAAVLAVMPTGDISARQVAHTQPAKFAAIEGLNETQEGAGLVVAAIPSRVPPLPGSPSQKRTSAPDAR